MRTTILLFWLLAYAQSAGSQTITVEAQRITEWKPVYGEVATRDRVPARARIGGTVDALDVTEGDRVEAGSRIANIADDKLAFRIDALEAQLGSLRARIATAETDLRRGEQLMERGVITAQRLDQLRTDVDVLRGEISSLESERLVVEQQVEEGEVLAPEAGVVLSVPVSRGSVVTPGDPIAEIGGGGAFLRLQLPERYATDLAEGDSIEIGAASDSAVTGVLAKLYPLIAGGRVQADVEVEGLDARFVGRRLPVRLPVAEREAILVPDRAIATRGGLDFVTVETAGGPLRRVVVPGAAMERAGETWREILTGLAEGDVVVLDNE